MTRLNIAFMMLVILTIVVLSKITVFAEEHLLYEVLADSDFTQYRDVCIDPGHGGPTAQKFGNNGDGAGTYGCCYNLSEQWINLQVAYALRDSLYPWCNCPGQIVMGVIMTRDGQTDIAYGSLGLWRRVLVANYANVGGPVYEFISIHHNGFEDTSSAPQGTESFWWNATTTPDTGASRDTTSKLARKVRMKIHDIFNTDAECYECYENRGTRLKNFFVLKNSIPASALPEASDIHALMHWDEELRFMDSTVFWHSKVEAGGIMRGWCSYKNNSGLVTIRNSAATGGDGYIWTQNHFTGRRTEWASPYYTCWEKDEFWYIDFPSIQIIGGYNYVTFHHCEELEHGYYSTDNRLCYLVPDCSTHTIVGYYTGGPYSAELTFPNGGQQFHNCNNVTLCWNASTGADSTTRIDVYISRDGGQDYELICGGLPNTGSYVWNVSGLASEQCRMKVVAHDTAGNQTYDISEENFSIQAHTVVVTCPDSPLIWWEGEHRTITWECSHLCTTSHADIYISRDGGESYEPIISDLPNTGSYGWTVASPYSTHCRIRVVVEDIVGNLAEDVSDRDFIISESGNNDPEIEGHIHCKYPSEECEDCIHYGETVTIQVDASDPDGDSIFYDWFSWFGYFAENGQQTITTSENWVTYVAPAKVKEGQTAPFQDLVSVAVTDVRGGQSYAVGHPHLQDEPYYCMCGDVQEDGKVNVNDALYILNYLFRGGAPIPSPMERADANSDCEVDLNDVLYMLNYLFKGGSPIECCWFPPE